MAKVEENEPPKPQEVPTPEASEPQVIPVTLQPLEPPEVNKVPAKPEASTLPIKTRGRPRGSLDTKPRVKKPSEPVRAPSPVKSRRQSLYDSWFT